jgi:hypothetical protein
MPVRALAGAKFLTQIFLVMQVLLLASYQAPNRAMDVLLQIC